MYANFLENTGISTDDREFGITMKDYYGGSFMLFGTELRTDVTDFIGI